MYLNRMNEVWENFFVSSKYRAAPNENESFSQKNSQFFISTVFCSVNILYIFYICIL